MLNAHVYILRERNLNREIHSKSISFVRLFMRYLEPSLISASRQLNLALSSSLP